MASLTPVLHVDLVGNDWHGTRQYRVGRVVAEGNIAPFIARDYLDLLAEKWGGGSYRFLTDPHTDDECPFKDGEEVRMELVEHKVKRVEGEWRL